MNAPAAPRVIGLDLSITATGVALHDGTTTTILARTGDLRLVDIQDAIVRTVDGQDIDLVVIEDLPTHAKAAGITGMVHGAVRTSLLRLGVPYALVTPASLKKYATGRGNAGKPEMAVAAYKRAQAEFEDDNQCDAWWLRAAGLDHLGHPIASLPAAQRAALDAVTWPAA